MSTLNVAYILLHFPYLTETFVAEEIQAIRSRGIDVRIVSLLEPGPGPVQPLSKKLLAHTWYTPGLLSLRLWSAQLYFFLKSPAGYLGLLLTLLRQDYPRQPLILLAKRLVIFLKAVATAHYLKDSDVQVLHSHFAWLSGAATWLCARLLDLPFTTTVHAYDIYFSNELLPLVSSQADQIIAISEYNRQQVLALGSCSPDRVSVIHCGVNLTTLRQVGRIGKETTTNNQLKILSIGSLVEKKGHMHLINACSQLKQQGLDFICTIIGGGPQETSLRQQIQGHNLKKEVKLLGPRTQPEVLAAYQEHDLFVLASVVTAGGDRDGIPVVLMEAGAMGLPLISTQVSGIPELVRHGETGWLVPPGDDAALASGIFTLAKDPNLCARLGQKAEALVKSDFEIGVNAQRLIDLFQTVHRQHDSYCSGQR